MLLDTIELAEKLEKEKLKSDLDKEVSVPQVDFEEPVDSLKAVESLYREEED